jgi:hypothetical protein
VLTDPAHHLPLARPDAEALATFLGRSEVPVATADASLTSWNGLLVVTASRLLFVALGEVVEEIPLRSISTLQLGGHETSGKWLTVTTGDEKRFVFQSLPASAGMEVVSALVGGLDRPDLRTTFEPSEAKSS